MTNEHSHPAPSSIRDDSICEPSLNPNKSSGDIVERLPRVSRLLTRAPGCAGTTDAARAWMVDAAAEIERLRREVEELREWKSSVLSKCKSSDCWDALRWGGDKEGWGFVHYFIGYLNTRALTAESAVAAAREDEREGCALVAENAYTGRTKTGTHPLQIARAIRARASAIRAAGADKTAESGHSPSTHNSASE